MSLRHQFRSPAGGEHHRPPAGARATSMEVSMVSVQALVEIGLTMPEVPRMESPPMIPSRSLSVFLANSSPLGMLMVKVRVAGMHSAPARKPLLHHLHDHLAGHRVDGPFPDRHREAGLGDLGLCRSRPGSHEMRCWVKRSTVTVAWISAPLVTVRIVAGILHHVAGGGGCRESRRP